MRTGEGSSTDWAKIAEAYRTETTSIRALARRFEISDTAIRKEARKRGWARPAMLDAANREPGREPGEQPANRTEATAKTIAASGVAQLTVRGRNIILALMSELEFLNSHHLTLSELVESEFTGRKDDRIRAKLLKALDHETRTKSSNYLATALAKLQETAPGKKADQKAAAEAVAAGGDDDWGDDLATPAGKYN